MNTYQQPDARGHADPGQPGAVVQLPEQPQAVVPPAAPASVSQAPARPRISTGSHEVPRIDCRTQLSKEDDLVRGAIFTQRKSRMGSAYLHILSTISNRLPDLVIYTTGREIRKSCGERYLTANGESRRNTNHIGFSNTALNKAIWVFFYKCL